MNVNFPQEATCPIPWSMRLPVVAGLSLALLLSGCKGAEPYADLRQYMDNVKQQQANNVSRQKLDIHEPKAVVYDGNMRRSPFMDTEVAAAGQLVKQVVTNPLQAYSLSMLRLLGTVTENGATVAYITAPDNMVYRIQVGDIIGDRHGKVINIQPGNVNVMELDADNPGEQMQRVVSLRLRSESP